MLYQTDSAFSFDVGGADENGIETEVGICVPLIRLCTEFLILSIEGSHFSNYIFFFSTLAVFERDDT